MLRAVFTLHFETGFLTGPGSRSLARAANQGILETFLSLCPRAQIPGVTDAHLTPGFHVSSQI